MRLAITEAWARAEVSGPEGLDSIESHGCSTTTGRMAIV